MTGVLALRDLTWQGVVCFNAFMSCDDVHDSCSGTRSRFWSLLGILAVATHIQTLFHHSSVVSTTWDMVVPFAFNCVASFGASMGVFAFLQLCQSPRGSYLGALLAVVYSGIELRWTHHVSNFFVVLAMVFILKGVLSHRHKTTFHFLGGLLISIGLFLSGPVAHSLILHWKSLDMTPMTSSTTMLLMIPLAGPLLFLLFRAPRVFRENSVIKLVLGWICFEVLRLVGALWVHQEGVNGIGLIPPLTIFGGFFGEVVWKSWTQSAQGRFFQRALFVWLYFLAGAFALIARY